MKKIAHATRPLTLHRETLRALDPNTLRRIDGAATLQNSCDPISALRCPGSAQSFCEFC